MTPITYEMVDEIAKVYPEIESIRERAKMECSVRNTFPAIMRSLGKRDGLPEGLDWIFEASPFASAPSASEYPQAKVRVESVAPPEWRELVSKLDALASVQSSSGGQRELLLDILGELKSVRVLLSSLAGK